MMANYWTLLILVLLVVPSTGLICYNCFCPPSNVSACNCDGVVNAAEGSHCTIVEDLHPADPYIELGTAPADSSYLRIKDPYYILVDEVIYYNETSSDSATKTKRVVHGCDWDFCNKFELIAALPDSFQLNMETSWLQANIYGTGNTSACHTCPGGLCGNATQSIDYGQCPFTQCENSTTVSTAAFL
jgi:hypothetical protein